jgi:hypothetical protein
VRVPASIREDITHIEDRMRGAFRSCYVKRKPPIGPLS